MKHWTVDGAAVRVSLVCFDGPDEVAALGWTESKLRKSISDLTRKLTRRSD